MCDLAREKIKQQQLCTKLLEFDQENSDCLYSERVLENVETGTKNAENESRSNSLLKRTNVQTNQDSALCSSSDIDEDSGSNFAGDKNEGDTLEAEESSTVGDISDESNRILNSSTTQDHSRLSQSHSKRISPKRKKSPTASENIAEMSRPRRSKRKNNR